MAIVSHLPDPQADTRRVQKANSAHRDRVTKIICILGVAMNVIVFAGPFVRAAHP